MPKTHDNIEFEMGMKVYWLGNYNHANHTNKNKYTYLHGFNTLEPGYFIEASKLCKLSEFSNVEKLSVEISEVYAKKENAVKVLAAEMRVQANNLNSRADGYSKSVIDPLWYR